jgi:hypothetical protein
MESQMSNYIVEFKNNATGKTEMVKVSKAGQQYVQNYQNIELDSVARFSVLNEIQMNYLESEIDLTKHTIHMVSDLDMSQVI